MKPDPDELTEAQAAVLASIKAMHKGVRWRQVSAPECVAPAHQPILIQWRQHGGIRSRMVFIDGTRGPLGQSAVFL